MMQVDQKFISHSKNYDSFLHIKYQNVGPKALKMSTVQITKNELLTFRSSYTTSRITSWERFKHPTSAEWLETAIDGNLSTAMTPYFSDA